MPIVSKIEYLKYLISDKWKKKRDEKLWKQPLCEHCRKEFGKNTKATQVHHISYETLGKEKLSDLISVCNYCHILLEIKKINTNEYDKIMWEIEMSDSKYLKKYVEEEYDRYS